MNKLGKVTPIVIFAYNRADHIKRLLISLKRNPESSYLPIKIYCDGPKRDEDIESVEYTRRVVQSFAPKHSEFEFRDENWGLAKSIIHGVTRACEEYGRVIVLEDDLILSSTAIRYLIQGLNFYENDSTVAHISAYMFPVRKKLKELFFYREMTCWGWATWQRSWKDFEPDSKKILDEIVKRNEIKNFNNQGTIHFYEMLCQQAQGKIDSWAIRWYGTNFLKGRLALHPAKSLVENEGFDGTGVHCKQTFEFKTKAHDVIFENFPSEVHESRKAVLAMRDYRSAPILSSVKLKRIVKEARSAGGPKSLVKKIGSKVTKEVKSRILAQR